MTQFVQFVRYSGPGSDVNSEDKWLIVSEDKWLIVVALMTRTRFSVIGGGKFGIGTVDTPSSQQRTDCSSLLCCVAE